MKTPWESIAASVTRLSDKMDALPSFREATVAAGTPLSVVFDTDLTPTEVNFTLVGGIAPGTRVLTLRIRQFLWVVGVRYASNHSVSQSPIGEVKMWLTDTPPTGYLLVQGQAVSRTAYPELFSVLGTTYGAGDGSTTFNLPDLRGRVPVGKSTDTEFDTLGKKYGTKTHTLTSAEIPPTRVRQETASSALQIVEASGTDQSGTNRARIARGSGNPHLVVDGGGGAHNNIQPSIALNYIIRAL